MYETIIEKDKLISLDENSHKYSLLNSNIEFRSVTEFIGDFFEKFDEIKVAKKLTNYGKFKGLTTSEILKDWEKRRNDGTVIHYEIEKYINNFNSRNFTDNEKRVDELNLKSKQAIKFLNDCDIFKNNLIFPEVKIFSETLKLAGTIDLLIYNKPKNIISLVDWKTNEKIKKISYRNGTKEPTLDIGDCSYNKYELQLTMYRYILEKYYDAKVNGLYILHLKENNYNYLNCDYKFEIISRMIKHDK